MAFFCGTTKLDNRSCYCLKEFWLFFKGFWLFSLGFWLFFKWFWLFFEAFWLIRHLMEMGK
jgi:hypothetical protein